VGPSRPGEPRNKQQAERNQSTGAEARPRAGLRRAGRWLRRGGRKQEGSSGGTEGRLYETEVHRESRRRGKRRACRSGEGGVRSREGERGGRGGGWRGATTWLQGASSRASVGDVWKDGAGEGMGRWLQGCEVVFEPPQGLSGWG